MSAQPREQWSTRAGFLFAAIGSAVGLGNIWRFPAVAYEAGGGAFLLPYLIALLTAGIPLLILEYTIGRRYRASAPGSFRRMWRPAEALGWWQVAICFVIAAYYAVILAWAVRYVGFSVNLSWGDDPDGYFYNDFLQVGDEPGAITSFVPGVAWTLLAVWLLTLVVLWLGVRRGIEWCNRIFIPLLVVFFLILVVRALTLDGAFDGLDAFFSPDWNALTDSSVWIAAYGQIFFSLSVGFGVMITYASYLKRRADLSGSALAVSFSNCSFELLAGIGVFAVLGFMAAQAGVPVDEVVSEGIGLAFVAFPQIVSQMPAGAFFGVLFFVSLVAAGLTSLISIVQVIVSAVQEHTGISRTRAVLIIGGALTVTSTGLFATDGGLYLLDAADHFINSYGVTLAALAVLIVVSWYLRKLPQQQAEADSSSSVRLGVWWRLCLGVITPVVLGWMMVDSLTGEFSDNYSDYPTSFLLWGGWGVAVGALIVGVVMSLLPWRRDDPPSPEREPLPATAAGGAAGATGATPPGTGARPVDPPAGAAFGPDPGRPPRSSDDEGTTEGNH
ncbi:sodium-dependent transporter [Streptomyces spiramenti]|uniref:Sodium-dependent transporter n=1 Tax=Streptomyces spiramenti TaxID=2720606 RepID=A0ABX1AJH4_9ACTN|nr:sodium-dependent transporter [Streptomyces spiramenti]NJP65250.1 sodium-dependent transporter [Streptomyces spiramenti]